MHSKFSSVLFAAIVLTCTLAACAGPAASVPTTTTPAALTAVPAAAAPTAAPKPPASATPPGSTARVVPAYPLVLKDDLGREVALAAQPVRIVSLAPSVTEILFAVGAGPQVAGLTKYCNYPPEAGQGREIVGGFSAKSLSVEKIVSLRPDLVFAAGTTHSSVSEPLEAAGIRVFNVDPKDIEGVYASILATGALTGNRVQAEKVVAEMRGRIDRVRAGATSIPANQRAKVFYEVWDEPLMTAGPASFMGQLIDLAGGVNVFGELKEEYPTVSSEAVVARNPDVILGPSSHGEALTAEQIATRPGWKGLAATKAGHIVIIDGDTISRAGPRLADALEAVARGIYPERFR